jgi:hypothetical protein
MQQYEFARWFKEVECLPQIAHLSFMRRGDGGHPTLYATFHGTITANNHQSCFGGVPFGAGGVNDEVGKESDYLVAWEAEFTLGALLAGSDYTYAFDIDLEGLDIQWKPWKSASNKPGDILYREDKPWDNLPSTRLKADITPLDPELIKVLWYEAVHTLKDYPNGRPEFLAHWTQRRDYMAGLLERLTAPTGLTIGPTGPTEDW